MGGLKPSPAWALLALAFVVLAAHAASHESPQRCAGIGEDGARLACYDSIFRTPAPSAAGSESPGNDVTAADAATPAAAAPAAPAAAAAPPVAAAGTVASAATNPETDFGLTEAAKRARDPQKAQEQYAESITGKVAAVGYRPAGELAVTLENSQVWTQVTPDPRARVAVGDTVTIKRASLGSYLLVTASRYPTRVRRLK